MYLGVLSIFLNRYIVFDGMNVISPLSMLFKWLFLVWKGNICMDKLKQFKGVYMVSVLSTDVYPVPKMVFDTWRPNKHMVPPSCFWTVTTVTWPPVYPEDIPYTHKHSCQYSLWFKYSPSSPPLFPPPTPMQVGRGQTSEGEITVHVSAGHPTSNKTGWKESWLWH